MDTLSRSRLLPPFTREPSFGCRFETHGWIGSKFSEFVRAAGLQPFAKFRRYIFIRSDVVVAETFLAVACISCAIRKRLALFP